MVYYLTSQQKGRLLLLILAFIVIVVDYLRLHINGVKEAFILFFGSFLRRHEFSRLSGATYLLFGCLITSLLFKKPIVVAACSFTIVGDTLASVLGQNIKSPKLFKKKTILGSAGFLASSLIVAIILYNLPGTLTLHHLIIGAVAATLFEALPLPWNDNFSIPIITGAIMSLLPEILNSNF